MILWNRNDVVQPGCRHNYLEPPTLGATQLFRIRNNPANMFMIMRRVAFACRDCRRPPLLPLSQIDQNLLTPRRPLDSGTENCNVRYFPMQNVLKIKLRMSSAVVAPVISSNGRNEL